MTGKILSKNKKSLSADAASPEKSHFRRQHFAGPVFWVALSRIKRDALYELELADRLAII
jgi:hypothetical protein